MRYRRRRFPERKVDPLENETRHLERLARCAAKRGLHEEAAVIRYVARFSKKSVDELEQLQKARIAIIECLERDIGGALDARMRRHEQKLQNYRDANREYWDAVTFASWISSSAVPLVFGESGRVEYCASYEEAMAFAKWAEGKSLAELKQQSGSFASLFWNRWVESLEAASLNPSDSPCWPLWVGLLENNESKVRRISEIYDGPRADQRHAFWRWVDPDGEWTSECRGLSQQAQNEIRGLEIQLTWNIPMPEHPSYPEHKLSWEELLLTSHRRSMEAKRSNATANEFSETLRQAEISREVKRVEQEKTLWSEKVERKKRARARQDRDRALAAAYLEKSRKLAESVRRALLKQRQHDDTCPYCSGPLGDDARADHITPVAMNGLSVEENMILVCISCNGNKSDLTLREFVKRFGLNWPQIEQYLESHGKRF